MNIFLNWLPSSVVFHVYILVYHQRTNQKIFSLFDKRSDRYSRIVRVGVTYLLGQRNLRSVVNHIDNKKWNL